MIDVTLARSGSAGKEKSGLRMMGFVYKASHVFAKEAPALVTPMIGTHSNAHLPWVIDAPVVCLHSNANTVQMSSMPLRCEWHSEPCLGRCQAGLDISFNL